MYFRFSSADYWTLGLMALTLGVAVARFMMTRIESSWPLMYYAALILYWKTYEGALDGYWVLAGVICGLMMRFEFLGRVPYKLIRVAEAIVLAYVMVRCFQILTPG